MNKSMILAMFHRQVSGDHHLLELAQKRFTENDIGPEFYPQNLQSLQESIEFRPLIKDSRYVIHLPRDINIFNEVSRKKILEFAGRSRKDALGMVVHDQKEIVSSYNQYLDLLFNLDTKLQNLDSSPILLIEYAVGLDPFLFIKLIKDISACKKISTCIDVSHIGIRQAQHAFYTRHANLDACSIKPNAPNLDQYIEDIVWACESALPSVIHVVEELGKIGKHIHFHLHDGHTLSTFSPYKVCDHLSFFHEIFIPFEFNGAKKIPLMFGTDGLKEILGTIRDSVGLTKSSLSIEIHPQEKTMELGRYEYLFENWKNKHNAMQMNAWIEEIIKINLFIRENI